MTPRQLQLGVDQLVQLRDRSAARQPPIVDLPVCYRPTSLAHAYTLQAEVAAALAQGPAGPSVGWKIGCTTEVMQQYLHIRHPCAGRLYAAWLYRDHCDLHASDYHSLGLECEIAVQLSAALPEASATYDASTVASAVSHVCASIEIVEHRFADFAKAETVSLVADDFFSAGCVHGALVPIDEVDNLTTLRGGFSLNAANPELLGTGDAILGHPLNALAWLANHAIDNQSPLEAGQIITLGSVVKTIYPTVGTRVEARIEGLPAVSVNII